MKKETGLRANEELRWKISRELAGLRAYDRLDKGNPKLIRVPLYMLRIIQQYYDLSPKEFSKLPLRVRMALSDIMEYIPAEKS